MLAIDVQSQAASLSGYKENWVLCQLIVGSVRHPLLALKAGSTESLALMLESDTGK